MWVTKGLRAYRDGGEAGRAWPLQRTGGPVPRSRQLRFSLRPAAPFPLTADPGPQDPLERAWRHGALAPFSFNSDSLVDVVVISFAH